MLKFYVAHTSGIKVKKYEKKAYEILQKIYSIIKEKNDNILELCKSNTTKNIFKEDVNNFITLI